MIKRKNKVTKVISFVQFILSALVLGVLIRYGMLFLEKSERYKTLASQGELLGISNSEYHRKSNLFLSKIQFEHSAILFGASFLFLLMLILQFVKKYRSISSLPPDIK